MENNMRTTHLKLDPIETNTANFVSQAGPQTTTNHKADQKIIGQSVQFQKGMLSPIDQSQLYNRDGQSSPQVKKGKGNPMNTSMYRNQNVGVSSSQQHPLPPRRLQNEQLSPLAAFEIEREQTQ